MSGLIPEINKIAAYAKGDKVTIEDVNTVAHHVPEAVVFDMTESMARGEYNAAMSLLGELLDDKNNEPIMILAVLGNQMRQLYAASVAIQSGQGKDYHDERPPLQPSAAQASCGAVRRDGLRHEKQRNRA